MAWPDVRYRWQGRQSGRVRDLDRTAAARLRGDSKSRAELRAVLLPGTNGQRELRMVVPNTLSERNMPIPTGLITGILLAIPGYFIGVWTGTLFGLFDDQNTGVLLGY